MHKKLNIIIKDYFMQILHSIRNLVENNFQIKLLVVLEKHVYSTCVLERKWTTEYAFEKKVSLECAM